MFGCKQEGSLWDFSPCCHLRLKGCLFPPICSAFKRHTGGSQPITAHTTSKWRQWKPSTQISKQVLALYVRFFFPFLSFLKEQLQKNDCSQLKLHNLFFFVPWVSNRHYVENKASTPLYVSSKTGQLDEIQNIWILEGLFKQHFWSRLLLISI